MKTQLIKTQLINLLFVWLWAVCSVAAGQEKEKLTNADVVQLQKLDLGSNAIIEKIKRSRCEFDVSIKGLAQLKEAGVSNEVIQAVIAASGSANIQADPSQPMSPEDLNDPAKPHPPGIWVWQENVGAVKMVRLTASVISKIEGSWHGPYGSVHRRAVLAGERAALQMAEPRPTFYFYFERTETGFGTQESAVTSPNDFLLAQVEVKDKGKPEVRRRLEIGKFGPWGGSSQGVSEKATRAFDFEQVKPGIFKVQPQRNLEGGEYWFVFAGAMPHSFFGGFGEKGGKVFDFGIQGQAQDDPKPRARKNRKETGSKPGR